LWRTEALQRSRSWSNRMRTCRAKFRSIPQCAAAIGTGSPKQCSACFAEPSFRYVFVLTARAIHSGLREQLNASLFPLHATDLTPPSMWLGAERSSELTGRPAADSGRQVLGRSERTGKQQRSVRSGPCPGCKVDTSKSGRVHGDVGHHAVPCDRLADHVTTIR